MPRTVLVRGDAVLTLEVSSKSHCPMPALKATNVVLALREIRPSGVLLGCFVCNVGCVTRLTSMTEVR